MEVLLAGNLSFKTGNKIKERWKREGTDLTHYLRERMCESCPQVSILECSNYGKNVYNIYL